MSLRPSKKYLYKLLQKDLNKFVNKESSVLDAACNDCRNIVFFPECDYWGMDISNDALKKCQSLYGIKNLIKADLTKLENIKKRYDICVTTNTLEHIEDRLQINAVISISNHVVENGCYLLNKHKDQPLNDILLFLNKTYRNVEVVNYRNHLSRFYEKIIATNGNITHNGGKVSFYIKLFLTRVLFYIEHATSKYPFLNEAIYIKCYNKY